MKKFKYIQDIDDWLDPMNFREFWYAVEPFDLVLQERDHCEKQIASGDVDEETVLSVLKYMVRRELAEKQGLKRRPVTPWLQLVESH